MRHPHTPTTTLPPMAWNTHSRSGRWEQLKAEARRFTTEVLEPERALAHAHSCANCTNCAAVAVLDERLALELPRSRHHE